MKKSDPRDLERINIFHATQLAGTLSRTAEGAVFSYVPSYLENPRFSGISFHLKKRAAPYETKGINLHPFFAGLLPEGLRMKAMIRGLKTSADDLFTLFSALGSSCVGDVYPEDLVIPTTQTPPKLRDVIFDQYFSEIITKSVERISGNDTFAGIQNKLSAGVISFPLGIAKETKTYILKLNSPEFPRIVTNEHLCLSLAKKCRLNVTESKIVHDKSGAEGLLVSRFDRNWNETTSSFDLLHLEDACQFLDRYPSEKYRLSLRQVIEGIQQLSDTPQLDIIELLLQYAFSYLIGNGDMHAKNISLLNDSKTGRTILSPAYDIVSTLPYPLDQNMALKIDGKDNNINSKLLIRFANRFDIPEDLFSNRMTRFLNIYTKELPTFIKKMEEIIADSKKFRSFEKTLTQRLKSF